MVFEPLPVLFLTSDQVRQVPLFRATQQYRYPQREGGGWRRRREKNPIWEINSQHPTEPVLGSLAHSVRSCALVSFLTKACLWYSTRRNLEALQVSFVLYTAVCVCARAWVCVPRLGFLFFTPPPFPPPFYFTLFPLPSSPAPLPPSQTPNQSIINISSVFWGGLQNKIVINASPPSTN